MVSCKDIGKAVVAVFSNPASIWNGRTIECVSCDIAGDEAAHALSEASGERCMYAQSVPTWIQFAFMRELHKMAVFFENEGFSSSISEFLKIVPDAQGPREYFESIGQWSNGEKFKSRSD